MIRATSDLAQSKFQGGQSSGCWATTGNTCGVYEILWHVLGFPSQNDI